MTQRVEFGVPIATLQSAADTADKFFYSYKYVPISNIGSNKRQVITKSQWVYFAQALDKNIESDQYWRAWHETDEPLPEEHLTVLNPKMGPNGIAQGGLMGQASADVLMGMLRSQVGMLFLDRTRLSPAGLVVGEHIYALALAPGEEVTLEQSSFLQVERSNETQIESESTTDTEATTTQTADLSDIVSATLNQTNNHGFTAGGAIGFDYGVKVDVEAKDSNTTTQADTDSRTTTLKDVVTRTSKNASKLRDLHKTVVKVATTDRFEQSSRRVVRNPNSLTPIDLHWYKIFQRITFSHERYGVRLCWTPFVRDPAADFIDAELKMRDKMIATARDSIPEPQEPPAPVIESVAGTRVVGLQPPLTELNHWGGWPGSDMSANYTLPINIPENMVWDRDKEFVKSSLVSTLTGASRGYHVETVGDPWEVVDQDGKRTLMQIIHAGAGWRLDGSSQIWVSLSARCIPDGASLSAQQAKALEEWKAVVDKLRAERTAKVTLAVQQAEAAFEVWRTEHRRTLNVSQELLRRFINTMFPADARDEISELDLWNTVFDWDLASARLYSGSWNGDGALRFPELAPHEFLNACWARLYLPVRPGHEDIAMLWIFTRSTRVAPPKSIKRFTAKILKEMADWRTTHLGGTEEMTVSPVTGQVCPNVEQQYACLGTWTEDLPTDGVHMEVTQAPTSGADVATQSRLEAETNRINGMAAAAQSQAALLTNVTANSPQHVDLHVHVGDADS